MENWDFKTKQIVHSELENSLNITKETLQVLSLNKGEIDREVEELGKDVKTLKSDVRDLT